MTTPKRNTDVLTCGSFRLNLNSRPHIMGIVNVTDDSFSDGGLYNQPKNAYHHAKHLVASGADILDLGAESSRPGARSIPLQEELDRLLPALKLIRKLNVPISIDTTKPEVAAAALEQGAHIINDISGGRDSNMLQVVARKKALIVLMHMQGSPRTMQKNPTYRDVVSDVKRALLQAAAKAVKAGIKPKNIILDPGIGFGKTMNHNLQLINRLAVYKNSGYPILLGPSRKSFIGKLLDDIPPEERDWGTAAAVSMSVANGAHIIRVHDVGHMSMVSKVTHAIKMEQSMGGRPCRK